MSVKIVGGSGGAIDVAAREYVKTSTAATGVGDLLSDTGAGLTRSTSTDTVAGATTFHSVAQSIQTASQLVVQAVRLVPGMLLEMDTTANTASNQVNRRRPVTDHLTLDNSSTDSNANTAPFRIVALVGAAADRKCLVEFLGIGQLNS